MFNNKFTWIVTYIPAGSSVLTTTTEVTGNDKLQAQQYFSKYYEGKIVKIEQKF